jgi:hypothetical protein
VQGSVPPLLAGLLLLGGLHTFLESSDSPPRRALPSPAAGRGKDGVELAAGHRRREQQGGKENGGRDEEDDMWSP